MDRKSTTDDLGGLRQQIFSYAMLAFPKIVGRQPSSAGPNEVFDIVVVYSEKTRYRACLVRPDRYQSSREDDSTPIPVIQGAARMSVEEALRSLLDAIAYVLHKRLERRPEDALKKIGSEGRWEVRAELLEDAVSARLFGSGKGSSSKS